VTAVLSVRNLTVRYGRGRNAFNAVDDVTFELEQGETLGIVGESGCGKSTVARAVVGLTPIERGVVEVNGGRVAYRSGRARRALGQRVQLIFQNPDTALDPRMTVKQSLAEALAVKGVHGPRRVDAEVERLLDLVALDARFGGELPGRLSGGQRQRVAIARALAVEPAVIIADEITSALDVSVQGTVLNLLRDLQARLHLSLVFIGHNLATVRYMSSRLVVMYLGTMVETGAVDDVLAEPAHPYTRGLLAAVPSLDNSGPTADRMTVLGEPPDPAAPPSGCRFHPRCPVGPVIDPSRRECVDQDPRVGADTRLNGAACHFAATGTTSGSSDGDRSRTVTKHSSLAGADGTTITSPSGTSTQSARQERRDANPLD
jgi:peptide/nickel transport system ATP-binding protein